MVSFKIKVAVINTKDALIESFENNVQEPDQFLKISHLFS